MKTGGRRERQGHRGGLARRRPLRCLRPRRRHRRLALSMCGPMRQRQTCCAMQDSSLSYCGPEQLVADHVTEQGSEGRPVLRLQLPVRGSRGREGRQSLRQLRIESCRTARGSIRRGGRQTLRIGSRVTARRGRVSCGGRAAPLCDCESLVSRTSRCRTWQCRALWPLIVSSPARAAANVSIPSSGAISASKACRTRTCSPKLSERPVEMLVGGSAKVLAGMTVSGKLVREEKKSLGSERPAT